MLGAIPVDHTGHFFHEPREGAASVAESDEVSYVAVGLVHCQRHPESARREGKCITCVEKGVKDRELNISGERSSGIDQIRGRSLSKGHH